MDEFINKLFQRAPNYMIAFIFCLMGTVFAAMSHKANINTLLLCDANVGFSLLMAYWLDPNTK